MPVEHPIPAFGIRVTGPSDADPAPHRDARLHAATPTRAPGSTRSPRTSTCCSSEAAYVEGRDDALRGIHLTGRRAGEAAARGGVGRLVLTHIPAWNDPAVTLPRRGAVYDGPIDAGPPGRRPRRSERRGAASADVAHGVRVRARG